MFGVDVGFVYFQVFIFRFGIVFEYGYCVWNCGWFVGVIGDSFV